MWEGGGGDRGSSQRADDGFNCPGPEKNNTARAQNNSKQSELKTNEYKKKQDSKPSYYFVLHK